MEQSAQRLHNAIERNHVDLALAEIQENPEMIKYSEDAEATPLKRMFCLNRYKMAEMTLAMVPDVDFRDHPGLIHCMMNTHPREHLLLLLYKYGFPFGLRKDVPTQRIPLQKELQTLIVIASVRIPRLGSKSLLRRLPNALLFNALPRYIRTS
jgi:hypothetical protein